MRIVHHVLSLNYGGVETYVIRLSRGMAELGHEVAILTEGGPLEPLLEGSGVRILRMERNTHTIAELSRMVTDFGADVINAHNYHSARYGNAISRYAGIPYFMTVHGPRDFIRRTIFRDWSPTVITVSGSDKRGITGALGISPKRVDVTFLPVDPAQHYPRMVSSSVLPEMLPAPDPHLILHISRFSNRKALAAMELIKAMPDILQEFPSARLLLVGNGPSVNEIERRIANLNARYGQVARVEQPRNDISDFFNLATATVATATTALEAMACGSPLIAAGRTGYFGLVSEDNFLPALDLLFADHGRSPQRITASALRRDILQVLSNHESWRSESARIADKIAADFTPRAAAESVLAIYDRGLGIARN